jgi:hypothetical protein
VIAIPRQSTLPLSAQMDFLGRLSVSLIVALLFNTGDAMILIQIFHNGHLPGNHPSAGIASEQ